MPKHSRLIKKLLVSHYLKVFVRNTDQIREVLDNSINLKYTIMKNILLLMLIPLFGIAQTPSSLAVKGYLASNTEEKMLLLKNMKDAINFQIRPPVPKIKSTFLYRVVFV